jgi:uncharacterized protein involved in exopolysaccharide biosynthesis
LFVPFKDVPELGLQYLRLYRDYEIQNKLLEFILPLYEQAKIEEQRDVPVVQVLDRAVPPEKKARPFRTLIVVSVFASALTLFVVLSFINESFLKREKILNSLELKTYGFVKKVAKIYKIEEV